MKLSTLVLLTALVPSTAHALPTLSDDYARARAEATARHLPLFVDVWAPW